jgi:hypothetical protein
MSIGNLPFLAALFITIPAGQAQDNGRKVPV